MAKKLLKFGFFVFSILLICECCWARTRSLDSEVQVDAFISSLKKDSKSSQSLFKALKATLLYEGKDFNEKSALKFLSELEDANIEDPNDQDSIRCGNYLLAFTYLYYDDSVNLMNLYNNMSDYSRDRFFMSFQSTFLRKVGEPFFEVSRKYLKDLARRWLTEEPKSNGLVLSGIRVLTQSPKEKYIPVLKELLQELDIPRLYPATIVSFICQENLPGFEEDVKKYFGKYAIGVAEASAIAHYLVSWQGADKAAVFFLQHKILYEKKLKDANKAMEIVDEYLRRGDTQDK